MAASDLLTTLAAQGWRRFDEPGFIEIAGPYFSRAEAEGTRFCFPTDERHRNIHGVIQGGALMTFADRALAATVQALPGTGRTATVQFDFQFVAPVRAGEVVETLPAVVRDTRDLVFMHAVLTVEARTVAVASGLWKKLSSEGSA